MKINKCRVCSGSNLTECIDLGMQPWCNDFVSKEQVGKENKYPLALAFCDICGTLQVNYTVPKEIMYNDHTYLSGMNKSSYTCTSLSASIRNAKSEFAALLELASPLV